MSNNTNSIGALQEKCVAQGIPPPNYNKDITKTGPDHIPIFTCKLTINDLVSEGKAGSKQEAKQKAAEKMLLLLKNKGMNNSSFQDQSEASRYPDSPEPETNTEPEACGESSFNMSNQDECEEEINNSDLLKMDENKPNSKITEKVQSANEDVCESPQGLENLSVSPEIPQSSPTAKQDYPTMKGNLACEICCEPYQAEEPQINFPDRRPRSFCSGGHTFCKRCCESMAACHTCDYKPIEPPVHNLSLIKIIKDFAKRVLDIPEIKSSELERMKQESVAKGAAADIYLCKWNHNQVALKQLRIKENNNEKKSLKHEAGLAMSLRHPNIVQVFGVVNQDNGYMGIVIEWADQGSLRDQLKKISHNQKLKISFDICDGLSYLHENKIAHRDLKPENILLFTSDFKAKIADFGTSKEIKTQSKDTNMIGTMQYMAPELMGDGTTHGRPVDIYSLTIILYELFSGLEPFPGCDNPFKFFVIFQKNERPKIPKDFPALLVDLINRGWSGDPSKRPKIDEFKSILDSMRGADSTTDLICKGKLDYKSRFWEEYNPIVRLGRGGYGIVIEATNKIDGAHYAIKRVNLPTNANEMEKVKNEVIVLAKLGHVNIVRYHHTWIETPPPEWREPGNAWLTDSLQSEEAMSSEELSYGHEDSISSVNNKSSSDLSTFTSGPSSSTQNDSEHDAPDVQVEFQNSFAEKQKLRSDPQTYLYIVMQLCKKESLKDLLTTNINLDSMTRRSTSVKIFQQICNGVEYIHSQQLIHSLVRSYTCLLSSLEDCHITTKWISMPLD